MDVTLERSLRFKEAAANRQKNLTVVLENVHDPHNIGAVYRSCEAIGITEVYILNTDPRNTKDNFRAGKSSSSGAWKWVLTNYFNDYSECIKAVRAKYHTILTSHLHSEKSSSIFSIDLKESIALVFGNEHDGISQYMEDASDGNFYIPMKGLVQSLNISVACAVCLYEAFRQRMLSGAYDVGFDPSNSMHNEQYQNYIRAHFKEKYNLLK